MAGHGVNGYKKASGGPIGRLQVFKEYKSSSPSNPAGCYRHPLQTLRRIDIFSLDPWFCFVKSTFSMLGAQSGDAHPLQTLRRINIFRLGLSISTLPVLRLEGGSSGQQVSTFSFGFPCLSLVALCLLCCLMFSHAVHPQQDGQISFKCCVNG